MSDPKPFDKQSYRIGIGDKVSAGRQGCGFSGCLIIAIKPGVWLVALSILGIIYWWAFFK